MDLIRRLDTRAAMNSLEAEATSARGGFACLFASSDEFESALITERRAQGRYDQPRSHHWPLLMFVGCAMLVAGCMLLLH